MDQIIKNYGKDVKVAVCMNPLGFHKRAMPAAMAAYAALNQGKYWEYEKLVWENNKALEDADLESYAKQVEGLDFEKWKKDLTSKEIEGWILQQQATSVAMGATGTPAFFVNGQKLSGAKPYDEFAAIIEAQISKADRLMEKDVPLNALHTVLAGNAEGGKYRKYVIEGKMPPKVEQKAGNEAPKEPLAKRVIEIPIGDSPRVGHGDEVVITEFSDFQ